MPDHPTPGQVCYEAYQAAYACFIWTLPWHQLQPHFRRVWEAAAQAVRDLERRALVDGFAQATQERHDREDAGA